MRTAESERVARLVAMLEPVEAVADHYVGGRGDLTLPRIFGGEVLAQGLLAAARTIVPARPAHSLHAYFLRAGDPGRPVDYQVGRVRDGRRFACRTVTAAQDDCVLATMTVSFADTTGGVAHQRRAPIGPPPDEVSTLAEASQAWGGLGPSWNGFDAIDLRVDPRTVTGGPGAGDLPDWTDQVWQRVPGALPDDQLLHQAVLVYCSDVMLLASALVPHGVPVGREEVGSNAWDGVSLDHAIWFHRPLAADRWLLFEQCSPVARSGRAFARAEVFNTDGELVATVAQEGLIVDLGELPPPVRDGGSQHDRRAPG